MKKIFKNEKDFETKVKIAIRILWILLVILALFLVIFVIVGFNTIDVSNKNPTVQLSETVIFSRPIESIGSYKEDSIEEPDISDFLELENLNSQKRMLAQLVQAEAGNQPLTGMRLVADVVLNRVDDPRFPNTIEEVIFQKNPTQFSVTTNGAFEKAGSYISENAWKAVEMEWDSRLDYGVLYFSSTKNPVNGENHFKYYDHWFSY